MKGCEISLTPYKHWESWCFRCAKIGVLVAVGYWLQGTVIVIGRL